MIAAPLFLPSSTFDPLTMKPLAVSRWPLTDWLPAFRPPSTARSLMPPVPQSPTAVVRRNAGLAAPADRV